MSKRLSPRLSLTSGLVWVLAVLTWVCVFCGGARAAQPPLAGDVAAAIRSHGLYVQPEMSRALNPAAQARIREILAHSSLSPGSAPVVAVLETLPAGYDSPVGFAHALSDLHLTSGAAAVVIPHKVAAYSDAVAPAKMEEIQQESVPYFRRSLESGLSFLIPALSAAAGASAPGPAATPPAAPAAPATRPGARLAEPLRPVSLPAPEPSTRSSAVIGWVLAAVAAFIVFAWLRRRKGDLSTRKTGLTDFGYTVSEKVRQIDDLLPQLPDSPSKQKALELRQQAGSAFSEGMETLSAPPTAESLDRAQLALRRADGLLEQAQQQINASGAAPSART